MQRNLAAKNTTEIEILSLIFWYNLTSLMKPFFLHLHGQLWACGNDLVPCLLARQHSLRQIKEMKRPIRTHHFICSSTIFIRVCPHALGSHGLVCPRMFARPQWLDHIFLASEGWDQLATPQQMRQVTTHPLRLAVNLTSCHTKVVYGHGSKPGEANIFSAFPFQILVRVGFTGHLQ